MQKVMALLKLTHEASSKWLFPTCQFVVYFVPAQQGTDRDPLRPTATDSGNGSGQVHACEESPVRSELLLLQID